MARIHYTDEMIRDRAISQLCDYARLFVRYALWWDKPADYPLNPDKPFATDKEFALSIFAANWHGALRTIARLNAANRRIDAKKK